MLPVLALALLVQAPTADTTQVRRGLYVGASIGPSVVGVSCDECASGTGADIGLQLSAGLGVAVSPHLTIGLQLNGWNQEETDIGLRGWSLVASWYPEATGGAFIRPNIGIASFNGVDFADGPSEEGSGMIAGLTLGTDLRFDTKLSFTPTMTIQYANIGDSNIAGIQERSGIRSWMVGLGVGLTWH